ncbi:amidohydrolase family protein [Altererythrobacter aurantiacus]|uniref:Amidohydrolase family protein n=2 Tax=Parapontixanthobacter aurantiacus TaxID=1463599 RepID=A0A844ZCM5_9SPHN|nr:amidohydrolase [Parapontixanthobacter aurantiacus]MXO84670.1 amidohydrolase family protein [Parapontixanthobacter aurantiacus]
MMSRRYLSAPAAGLAMLTAAFSAAPAPADMLVDNVDGITLGEEGEVIRFVALRVDDDGKVAEIFERGDDLPRDVDYRLDGEGRTMAPGFIDSHLHVMGIGFGALTLDLSQTASLDEALAAIARFAEENPSRPWILGGGWNQEQWGLGRFPTAAELDAVVPDRPVYLTRVDGHAGWANSRALERAAITAKTADPDGGRIERLANGQPSGVFVDAAETLVTRHIPAPRPAERDLALSEAQKLLHAQGVTAAADMGTSIEDWQAYRRAGDAGTLTLRIMAYAGGVEAMDIIAGSNPTPWLYDDRLRLNGVKLYLDGALGSRGAWLKEPYADDADNTGLPLLDPAQLRNRMSRAAIGNFQLAIHAIGDAANAEVLSAVRELQETYTGDRRWRVEHAQVVDPSELSQFGELGLIASMQPVHQTSDRVMAEARLGPQRLDGAYAWRTIAENGATLALGSDAPVERPDPLTGMAVAISRVDDAGEPFGGWRPDETIERERAFAGYTMNGAYAGFAEGRFGRLLPGERADFVLLDVDPLMANERNLRDAEVAETWVGGKLVYRRDSQ